MEDIDIIIKQTNLNREEIIEIYQKNDSDIVSTICEIEGFTQKKKKKVILTETQEKIKQFRTIVDKKDEIMDKLIQKSK